MIRHGFSHTREEKLTLVQPFSEHPQPWHVAGVAGPWGELHLESLDFQAQQEMATWQQ